MKHWVYTPIVLEWWTLNTVHVTGPSTLVMGKGLYRLGAILRWGVMCVYCALLATPDHLP